jgi:hypothetical protein
LVATFDSAFALTPFGVALTPLAFDFDTRFVFALAGVVLGASFVFFGTFAFAAGFALVIACPFAAGLASVFRSTTLTAFVTFADRPLTLVLVAVLPFFAVANLIS